MLPGCLQGPRSGWAVVTSPLLNVGIALGKEAYPKPLTIGEPTSDRTGDPTSNGLMSFTPSANLRHAFINPFAKVVNVNWEYHWY